MARAITPEQREDLRSRLADNLAAVRFAGSGESGDDNLQRAADIEAKAFSAAERQGGDGAADAAVVREYSRAAGEMMTRAIDDVDGVSADDDDASSSSSSSSEDAMSGLAGLIQRLALKHREQGGQLDQDGIPVMPEPEPRKPLLSSFDIAGVAEYIKSGKCKRIVVMAGAGISVSAGIPDFRTPGTGLYDNLQKYNLPHPTAVFELDYFRENPKPFYLLAKELYPGNFPPTPTHHFIRLLHEKGLLARCFTQNIDSLEAAAGIPADKIVAAHGNFDAAHCLRGHTADVNDVKAHVDRGDVMRCEEVGCDELVKPDIVFFGEALPQRFNRLAATDFDDCDLLIVAGTSLAVHPFAGLVDFPSEDTPRLLVNREVVGELDPPMRSLRRMLGRGAGFDFSEEGNYRDALWLGDCDDGFMELATLCGWGDELREMCERK
uniref:Deacetylase sirtuin-type domain-containing protein n=1 Tax=Micromonas pusilla TaxID=38833 RepID=A0A7S0IKN5_MICPS|mmetsp:Transcript_8574/g.35112  ORF Transcript_8574/g.35112 Transcript_8574/m.35112 type:complete len:436 (+) Transcript_8574:13-1320(+)